MSKGKAITSLFFIAVLICGLGLLVLTVQKLQKKLTFQSSAANEEQICPVNTPPKYFTKAASVRKALNSKKLENTTHAFQKAVTDNKNADQLALIKKRKAYLLLSMEETPNKAITMIIPKHKRETYARIIRDCIETPTTRTGRIAIRHTDGIDPQNTSTDYLLTTTNNKRLIIHPTNEEKFHVRSGDTVTVTGYQLDNDLLIDTNKKESVTISSQSNAFPKAYADIPDAIGPQRVLVLPVNFQDKPLDTSITKSRLQDLVFNQTNKYFHEVSYGKVSLTGYVADPVTIPLTQSCDFYSVEDAAIAASDPSVDYTQVDRILLIAPYGPSCTFAGVSSVEKVPIQTQDGQINASISDVVDYFTSVYSNDGISVVKHELGHGLGVMHANFLHCTLTTFDLFDSDSPCEYQEYGDIYDVMGYSIYGHFNAPHKKHLGWFNPGNIQTVTSDGTYTLEPLETATNNLKAIQLQRYPSFGDGTYDDYLSVEYRQAIGFDSYLAGGYGSYAGDTVLKGALVHIGTNYGPYLIDPSPPGQYQTAALLPGQSITDPETGSKITVKSTLPTGLTLDVKLGKKDFTAPSVSIISPQDGSMVSGTITLSISASDASGISKIVVTNDSNYTSKTVATLTTPPYSVQLDTRKFFNGTNYLNVIAYDASGTPYNALNNSSYAYVTLDVQNPDSTNPSSIIVTAPGINAQVKNPMQVASEATDDNGIAYVEYYIDDDNGFYDSEQDPPYSIPTQYLSYYRLSPGQHAIYAKAYDYSGNVKISSPVPFTVIADTTKPSISITTPRNGDTVSGIIPITATAADDSGYIDYVDLYMDNNLLLALDSTAPYTTYFDTTTWGNGLPHTFYADAYDLEGNLATSSAITVTFANPTPTKSPISSPQSTITLRWGDANDDGKVDINDIKTVMTNWLKNLTTSVDQFGDGRINALDFVRVIKNM